jgi:2-dehydro-3-deoxyphosphogluconate aldolase / (4S)-4-hydroxy-2-oxoglutarate aldolase
LLSDEVASAIGQFGLIPVVELTDEDIAVPLFKTLSGAGLPVAEVTLRTPGAMEALGRVCSAFPGSLVGAGTVCSVAQAASAIAAGARFIVSPFTDQAIVRYCTERDILVMPGVCTPTEVHSATGAGASVLKFFPAGPMGGAAALNAFRGPFPGARFVPTGGVNSDNLADYLVLPSVLACAGTWLVAAPLLKAGDLAEVERLTMKAVAIVASARATRAHE